MIGTCSLSNCSTSIPSSPDDIVAVPGRGEGRAELLCAKRGQLLRFCDPEYIMNRFTKIPPQHPCHCMPPAPGLKKRAADCGACGGGHRAHTCGKKAAPVVKKKKVEGCGACRGGHRAHTCGKVIVPATKAVGCSACRGGHRAHTCGKAKAPVAKKKKATGCSACSGGHRAHTCGKKA